MGALLAFPPVLHDYTDDFVEWEQLPFRALSERMKSVVRRCEEEHEEKWQENMGILWESVNLADRVHPRIWIGSADAAESEDFIEKNQIDVILNMSLECTYNSAPSCRVVRIGIADAKLTNVGVFAKAAEVIANAVRNDENILVHCAAGVSRSCTAVVAHLMLYKGLGWDEALFEIREHRPCVNPHPLLQRSLMRDFGDEFID
jgi:predicted protein tyrosine phosphatase